MTPLAIVTAARKDALHSDTLGALDFTESVYRGLQRTEAAALGIHPDALAGYADLAKTAYDALAKLRILTDWRAAA